MTEEEIAQAIREAYLEGFREGSHAAAASILVPKFDVSPERIPNEYEKADHYTQTFFVKDTLAKGKRFLRG